MSEAQNEAAFSACLIYIQNLAKEKNRYIIIKGYNTSKNMRHNNKDRMYELLKKNVRMSAINIVIIPNMKVMEL